MSSNPASPAFVRGEDAPRLAPPATEAGITGWLLKNLFSSLINAILTILFGTLLLWLIWRTASWALFNATWSGDDVEACNANRGGACWPLIAAKIPQWVYGFFPQDQRWRVNTCFFVGAAALIPMLIPSVAHKKWNVLFLLTAFPLLTLILLTGGHFNFTWATYGSVIAVLMLAAAAIPLSVFGAEEGIARNQISLALTSVAVVFWLASFFIGPVPVDLAGRSLKLMPVSAFGLLALSAAFAIAAAVSGGNPVGRTTVKGWAIGLAAILAAMVLLNIDFGLVPVETTQWGGLTVTLVVSVTGIAASLPIGILLALGRRSKMPVVRIFSVMFIELWRGVPLITVLFMSSVMLPLFLPAGTNFDKLLRALIGVGMFSAAYMAEVVRSGLQAIPRGQYEGAMALGLSYWQMMRMIILPQALKIAIPNIVGNFISLFKDTTLVAIIGLFDLLGVVKAGLSDSKWATQSAAPTSYFVLALIFWVFCFGMSRYSIYTERRLHTGHKR